MLYSVLASIIGWSLVLFGLRVILSRCQPPVWAHRTITATGATVAVVSVLAAVLYSGLQQLLSETSILWTIG